MSVFRGVSHFSQNKPSSGTETWNRAKAGSGSEPQPGYGRSWKTRDDVTPRCRNAEDALHGNIKLQAIATRHARLLVPG
jgi:hypothetical protein